MWVPIKIVFEMGQRLLRHLSRLIWSRDVEAHQIWFAEVWLIPIIRLWPKKDILWFQEYLYVDQDAQRVSTNCRA